MTVYELGYQTYDGPRRGAIHRWFAIARFAWMEMLSRRALSIVFTLAWAQFVFRLAIVYLKSTPVLERMGLGEWADVVLDVIVIDGAFFKGMIDWQLPFCFLFAFVLGAGTISRDMAHNGLVLYAAKPIGRLDYFLGKFSTLFLLMMALSWLQTMTLFVVQTLVAPKESPWREQFWSTYGWLVVPITLYSVLICATLSVMILFFSSLARTGRYAGIAFLVYLVGAAIVSGILVDLVGWVGPIAREDWWAISPLALGRSLGETLFGHHAPIRPAAAWTGLAAIWLVCGLTLKLRLDQAVRKGA